MVSLTRPTSRIFGAICLGIFALLVLSIPFAHKHYQPSLYSHVCWSGLCGEPWSVTLPPAASALDVDVLRGLWEAHGRLEPLLRQKDSTTRKTPTADYDAAIIYLTSQNRAMETLASLETVARNMALKRAYPTLLLHDGDLSDPLMQEALMLRWSQRIEELSQSTTESPILSSRMEAMSPLFEFVRIDLTPPKEPQMLGAHGLQPVWESRWPGYQSMCRFFAVQVFEHPRIRALDYYMRLDTDSYFPEPVTYDPFDLAFSRNLSYISRKEDRDDNSVTIGMWSFLEAYVKDRSELKEQLEVNGIDLPLTEKSREEIGVPLWYNNFEVVHIPSFQRPDVKNWLSHLDAYWRGFYQFRWGDAPLRKLTTSMFFKPEQYRLLCSWDYYHGHTYKSTCVEEEDLRQ